MESSYALLIQLVRSQMDGTKPQIASDADFGRLTELAKLHKLEAFVYQALADSGSAPASALQALEGAYHRALFKDTQFDYTRDLISQKLSQEHIPHVFLRGICLKHDYPVPFMRTMSDMDALVRSEDLPAITQAMTAIGGKVQPGDGNHRSFLFPGDVMVEFHPNLLHCACPVGTKINPGWQYVPQQQGFDQKMTEEGYYLNVMAHLANHFVSGGIGVRFVLDIWVCRHLHQPQPDRAFVEKELERIGLKQFALLVEELAEVWFSGAPSNPLLEELGDYIFTSGSHGVADRAMLNAVTYASGSGTAALSKKVFYPRQEMENRYDWLRGRPWLLPVAWIARAWRVVTGRGQLLRRWRKGTGGFSKGQIKAQEEQLKRFGLR